MLRPMLSYYGGKWRVAPKYPKPEHDTIIEPFAGGAGYSLRYHERNVVLVEKNHKCAEVWRHLIAATEADILGLPLLEPGQTLDDFKQLSDGERWLIGWWLQAASGNSPYKRGSTWALSGAGSVRFWGQKCRARIASQVPHIKHWRIIEGDYTDAPDIAATWFIDPPYFNKGYRYPNGSRDIDFPALAEWCKSRRGLTVVCENTGADWLPFEHMADAVSAGNSGSRKSEEAVYIQRR